MNSNKVQRPLLSIVIPTRNRINYVKSAITSVLDNNDPRIELVIQDNSDSDELKIWIKENIDDSRLKYNYSNSPLSFVGNFSLGVEVSTGEYICIIGDDDGINPEIIQAAAWLKEEDIDCLSTSISANFVWGDAEVPTTLFTNETGGVLSISKITGNIIEAKHEKELLAFVKGGLVNYLDFNLPKIYHGIVKAECFNKIKNTTGSYFGGLSPDIFASITLACIAKKVFITDYPLTISGVCGVSASIVEGLLKKNSKKLEDAPHLRNRGHYEWSELVPKIYCVETIWADSAIAALKCMDRIELLNEINISKFSATCVNSNKGIIDQVIISMKYVSRLRQDSFVKYYILFILHLVLLKLSDIYRFFVRIANRVLIIAGRRKFVRISGLSNINDATVALTEHLSDNSILFKSFS